MNTFAASQFTATSHSTPGEKAKWANALVRFVNSGFKRSLFTRALYTRLSMCFGHIAHYDLAGFYAEWFSSLYSQQQWVQHIRQYEPYGDAAWTYCDVERAFKSWLAKQQ